MQEEFGEEEDEDEEDANASTTMGEGSVSMSETFQANKARELKKELKHLRSRQDELTNKMKRKVEEGTGLAGEKLFKECFEFFCLKAYAVNLFLT